jgi:hypothetical protein
MISPFHQTAGPMLPARSKTVRWSMPRNQSRYFHPWGWDRARVAALQLASRRRARRRLGEDIRARCYAAEVAEQTVYNYFPTMEHLAIDRAQQVQDRLCDLIRSRPPGASASAS